MKLRGVRDLLGEEEALKLDAAPSVAGNRHPAWHPVFRPEHRAADQLANQAVCLVGDAGGTEWLHSLRPRLIRLDDPEEAAAALAELRVYGGLLRAGFEVSPVPRRGDSTPDFVADAGDGPVVVEVFAKHQDEDQKELLEDLERGKGRSDIERSTTKLQHATMTTATTVLQPGGAPDADKPNDSTQANLISRLCAAKGNEAQFPTEGPSLLWIDLRNFGPWPEALALEQATPLISGRDGLTSGALWYAFYGWRGAPIFEEDFFPEDRVVPMGHNGRFRLQGKRKSRLSGTVVTLHEGTILLENPWASHKLPPRARRHCERLPWFDLSRSACDWRPGDALASVELGRRQIEAMYEWRSVLSRE